jgi:hypothetical protein
MEKKMETGAVNVAISKYRIQASNTWKKRLYYGHCWFKPNTKTFLETLAWPCVLEANGADSIKLKLSHFSFLHPCHVPNSTYTHLFPQQVSLFPIPRLIQR